MERDSMHVLLVGRWGKAHAMARALSRSDAATLYAYMDKENGAIAGLCNGHMLGSLRDAHAVGAYADSVEAELAVVSPYLSLSAGVADVLRRQGIPTVGASKTCSLLEGDKAFTRMLMRNHGMATVLPDFEVFHDREKALEHIVQRNDDFAVKPAGVTEGEGVRVMGQQMEDTEDAFAYVEETFEKEIGGLPYIIIEGKISGEEFTIQAFVDGEDIVGMPAVRDYKLQGEGEKGLNTPGMGSYSAADHLLPFLDRETYDEALTVMRDVLTIMRRQHNAVYQGFLSGQFMLTDDGLMLLEFNARPGDSELLNITPILETEFLEICRAIADQRLSDLDISFQEKATVCKYVVSEGFPHPPDSVEVHVNAEKIRELDGHLFQSCFEVGEQRYEPSPRLFAVAATGDGIYEAEQRCEKCLQHITGDGLFHRRDIGTPLLTERYL